MAGTDGLTSSDGTPGPGILSYGLWEVGCTDAVSSRNRRYGRWAEEGEKGGVGTGVVWGRGLRGAGGGGRGWGGVGWEIA